jgi:methionyl-tRNA synthetase
MNLMNLARLGNKYLTDNEPWKIFKQDPERTATILNVSLQICAIGCSLRTFPAVYFRKTLKCFQHETDEMGRSWMVRTSLASPGIAINKPEFLFRKN